LPSASHSSNNEKNEKRKKKAIRTHFQLEKKAFLKPMQELAKGPSAAFPITMEQVNSMFSNVELIYKVNQMLLDDIQKNMANFPFGVLKLGDIFLKMVPWFKLYTVYVSNYDNSLRVYSLYHKNPEFRKFLKVSSFLHAILVAIYF
jgi:hypothetical protein